MRIVLDLRWQRTSSLCKEGTAVVQALGDVLEGPSSWRGKREGVCQ